MKKEEKSNYLFLMSKSSFVILLVFVSITIIGTTAFSETSNWQSVKAVVFKEGSVVHGKIIQMNGETITIQQDDGIIIIRKYGDVTNFIGAENESIVPTFRGDESRLNSSNEVYSNYLVLKGGLYSPQSSELEKFNNGFNGEIAIGSYFNKNFAIEGGVGYFQTQASEAGYYYGGIVNTNANISVVLMTFSLKAILPIQIVEFYTLAGMGVYITHGEIKISPSFLTSDHSQDFGFHLGAGLNVNILPNIFLGVEGRYLWVKPSWDAYGVKVEPKLDGYLVTGDLGLRF